MALLPELRELALRGEDYLYQKHDQNSATSLLIEMLHARRREWGAGLEVLGFRRPFVRGRSGYCGSPGL